MALASYADIKQSVEDWLARSDITTFNTDFVTLAETRIYRELRVDQMEKALSDTIASGSITLPTDYLEMKYLYIDRSPTQYLERITPEKIYRKYPTRSAINIPRFFAREASTIIFGPYPDSAYSVKGIYFAKLPVLSDSNTTNWLTDDVPDLLLWASLLEAAIFIEDDENVQKYGGLYQRAKDAIEKADRDEEFSGSVLRTWAG